jgi:hypothetical protein
VGVGLPDIGETLAVKVTLDPALTCVADAVRVVVVAVGVRNVAVTDAAAVMEREQGVVVLEQAPVQPAKVLPAAAVAVKVTVVPLGKLALQVPGQLMPPVELVTEPEPETLTDNRKVGTEMVKVAVTDRATLMLTVHALAPVQAPPHPVKVEPAAGDAVKVTLVPLL